MASGRTLLLSCYIHLPHYNFKEEDSCGAKCDTEGNNVGFLAMLLTREKCKSHWNLDEKNPALITISAGFFIAFCRKFTGKLICFLHFKWGKEKLGRKNTWFGSMFA